MNAVIVCKDIKKTYGKKETEVFALRGVNLEVYQGEILMLAGPSGCGKTTLLSIVSGVLTQDSGQCRVLNTDINALENDVKTEFRGHHIGFLFQSFNLIPMLTAQENGAIPLVLRGENKTFALEKAKELLTTVGLEKKINAYPYEMSGGEQQRVAIVRSCIHKPEIIVADEPTSALDHETGQRILELFSHLAKENNSAIIIVTHDSRIFPFASRILHMEDGKINL